LKQLLFKKKNHLKTFSFVIDKFIFSTEVKRSPLSKYVVYRVHRKTFFCQNDFTEKALLRSIEAVAKRLLKYCGFIGWLKQKKSEKLLNRK